MVDGLSPEWVREIWERTTTRLGDVGTTGVAHAEGMDRPRAPLPPGTPAPDFTLPRSSYASVSLADARGRRVILVFYPADWEPVSQQQLTLYQHHLDEFARRGAVLLAVSTDHTWSHDAFVRAAGIHYPLLADAHPHGAVCRAYGAYDEQAESSSRTLFVLDEHGVVRWSQACPAAINPGLDGILTALESICGEKTPNATSPKGARYAPR
jgi:peroxiredoxin